MLEPLPSVYIRVYFDKYDENAPQELISKRPKYDMDHNKYYFIHYSCMPRDYIETEKQFDELSIVKHD